MSAKELRSLQFQKLHLCSQVLGGEKFCFYLKKKRPMNGQLTSKESQYMWVEGRVRKNMLHNKGGRRG